MTGFRPRFFVPAAGGVDLTGTALTLSTDDSHHAVRVLRLGEGDACEVVVGAAVYAATVVVATEPVTVKLTARLEGAEAGAAYRVRVGLVQALTRPAAMDFIIEKGTEVGASFILMAQATGSPAWSGRGSRERLTRWRRIAREAAKQSKHIAVPEVDLAGSIDEALGLVADKGALSLVLEPAAAEGVGDVLAPWRERIGSVALWVGPESGWSAAEAERFAEAGATMARLGRSILRTETAGPVAVAVARLGLGDW